MEEKRIIELLVGFQPSTAWGEAERLRLLYPLVHDDSMNTIARSAMEAGARSDAIRYLAGHPEAEGSPYWSWSHDLLLSASSPDREAYIIGVRRPAPASQLQLIARSLPAFDAGLRGKALKALKKGWRSDASSLLNDVVMQVRDGSLDPQLLLPAMHELADVALEETLPSLFHGLTSTSPALSVEALKATRSLVIHLFRMERFQELLAFHARLHHAFPENRDAALDHVDALIQYGTDHEDAAAIVKELGRQTHARRTTEEWIHASETCMASALIAFWAGGDWRGELSLELPGEGGGHPMKRARAKRDLLAGALEIVSGGNGKARFLSALEKAPYDPDAAEIDGLFTGRLSVSNLIWRLNRAGREEACATIFEQLVLALRRDRSGSGYYPDPGSSERVRSSIPVNEAYFLLHDLGRPEEAYVRLEAFIKSIRDSTYPANRDLMGRACYFQGMAALDLDRPGAALPAFKRGVTVYEQLVDDFKEVWKDNATESLIRYYKREKARGLLYQEWYATFAARDGKESARLAREAMSVAPGFDETLITDAMVRARNGGFEPARRLLKKMEPYPDRYYNMACLHALLGDTDEALRFLELHFEVAAPRRRHYIEKNYALRDPDLERIRALEAFKTLVGR